MKGLLLGFITFLACFFVEMPSSLLAQAPATVFAIKSVTPNILTPGQSLESAYRIDAKFELVYPTVGGESLRGLMGRNVSVNHWDCHDPRNFDVSITNGTAPVIHVKISRVSYLRAKTCSEAFPGTDAKDLQLWVDNNQPKWQSLVGSVTVTLLNLKGPTERTKQTSRVSQLLQPFSGS